MKDADPKGTVKGFCFFHEQTPKPPVHLAHGGKDICLPPAKDFVPSAGRPDFPRH
jgi:hypothetical protein